MIVVNGKKLKTAYTFGVEVGSIYCNRAEVWPSDIPPKEYYIKWTPTNLSGTFSLNGITYNFQDYNGYFSDFDGVITSYAFRSTGVETIETNAYKVDPGAIRRCSSLTKVSMSECLYMGEDAYEGVFGYCSSLSDVTLPKCISFGTETFKGCSSLQSINLPACKTLCRGVFRDCENLRNISLPVCEHIAPLVFTNCSIPVLSLPAVPSVQYGFDWCAIDSLYLPICSYIGESTFGTNVTEIYLGSSQVCTLTSNNSFTSIYVPSSLVSAYKVADNWSVYSSQIFPIPN